jgi:hypothetical protein
MALCLVTVVLTFGAAIWVMAGEDPARAGAPGEGKAEPNLPAVQQTSKPVKADDLEFQLVASTLWPMPAEIGKGPEEIPAGQSPVQFQLQVTNRGNKDIRVLMHTGTPILTAADGKELPVRWLGADHVLVPKFVSLAARKTTTIQRISHLRTYRKGSNLRLDWEDELGNAYQVEGLKPGKYSLKLRYNTRELADGWSLVKDSGAWLGDVRTAEVPVEIVELKASAPAVFNGVEALALPDGTWKLKKAEEMGWKDTIEVSALANGVWPVPAAGKQTQVGLGFRMGAVEKWCVRIVPSLAGVKIKSADGVELAARKTRATVPVDAPQLLGLEQRYSQSLASPAVLFHGDKALTLAWADGAGSVWYVDNLKPGRYSVRFVITADKGEPLESISYWTGEIQTEPVVIEIKG